MLHPAADRGVHRVSTRCDAYSGLPMFPLPGGRRRVIRHRRLPRDATDPSKKFSHRSRTVSPRPLLFLVFPRDFSGLSRFERCRSHAPEPRLRQRHLQGVAPLWALYLRTPYSGVRRPLLPWVSVPFKVLRPVLGGEASFGRMRSCAAGSASQSRRTPRAARSLGRSVPSSFSHCCGFESANHRR